MAFITKAEAKTLLGISDTSQDTLIETLLPLVKAEIIERTRNSFLVVASQIVSDTISFAASSPAVISDSDSGFLDANFYSGCAVKIYGSLLNDGIYEVTTVAAGSLTLATGETLVAEAVGEEMTVTRVKWPQDLKLDAAHIINYYLTKQGKLVTSETLPGGYSVDFKSDSQVWARLNKWRKPYK